MKSPFNLHRVHPLHAIAGVCLILMALMGIAKLSNAFTDNSVDNAQTEAEQALSAAEAVSDVEIDNSERTFTSIAPPVEDEWTLQPSEEYVLVETPEKAVVAPAETAPAAPAVVQTAPNPAANAPVQDKAATQSAAKESLCWNCGVVTHIEELTKDGKSTGLGTVTGAIIGGVAGHQMGGGDGKKVMTAVGAIGGAIAGNTIEKKIQRTFSYRVHLQMDHGGTQALNFAYPPQVSVGEAVKVENGELIRN